MTLTRLAILAERWGRIPPLSVSTANIAIWLGAQKAPRQGVPVQAANDEAMGDLVAAMGGVTSEMPEWLKQAMT